MPRKAVYTNRWSWFAGEVLPLTFAAAITAVIVHSIEVYGWNNVLGRLSDSLAPVAKPFGNPSNERALQIQSAAADSVTPDPFDVETTWWCQRIAPFTDACSYRNICHDGEFWYFIDRDALKKNGSVDPIFWPRFDFKTGVVYPMKYPVPIPDKDSMFPLNGGGAQGKRRTPQMLADMKDLVTWETDVPWFPAFQHSLDNIYYWASRMLPIYSARLFNDTPAYNRKFPPLDFLFIPGGPQAYSKEWHNVTRDVCVGREGVRVEYGSGTWAAAWRSSPRQWKCFKRAVILGTNSMAVEDPATAWRFREDVYAKLGMRLPSQPVKKVLFWLRTKNYSRWFYNLAEMLAIADKYNIPYTVVEKVPPDFISQVNLVADHGVIVAPHGAGLMNLMFMPPFGAVVEIFPYQTHHNLYSGIAAMVGVAHYPVHTYNGTETLSDANYHKFNCSHLTNFEWNHVSANCKATSFHRPIWVDLYAFETALVNAWVHIGVNTDVRGVRPVEDPTTVTGWK